MTTFERAKAEVKFTLDNVTQAILDYTNTQIEPVLEEYADQYAMAKYLILKELWNKLTVQLGLDADALREMADEMEEAIEDEDEELS